MPLYEYQCEACAHRFEVIQKYSDAPVDTCPKCGGVVRKLLSSPAIQFKGTGWYITDYARSGKTDGKADSKGENKGQSESSGDSAAASAAKSDKPAEASSAGESKPAARVESKPASSAKTDS